eukprot:SAG31_NODE_470_length_15239_cov_19.376288_7_plen_196_part_00
MERSLPHLLLLLLLLLLLQAVAVAAAAAAVGRADGLPQCAPFTIIDQGIADNASSIFHGRRSASSALDCCSQCKQTQGCGAWTFHGDGPPGQHHTCWMMKAPGPARPHASGTISGVPPPAPPAPAPPAPAGARSVLMIAVDDLRDEPGGFGGDAHTPVLDELAAKSAVMRLNYVQQAVCGPTRASILCAPDFLRS